MAVPTIANGVADAVWKNDRESSNGGSLPWLTVCAFLSEVATRSTNIINLQMELTLPEGQEVPDNSLYSDGVIQTFPWILLKSTCTLIQSI